MSPADTDLNLVVVCGRLAVDAEVRRFDSGAVMLRYLVTVRVEAPRRRVDVLPVVLWDADPALIEAPGRRGDRVWVCGSLQRRHWDAADGRRSRIELVAEQVNLREVEAVTS